jgi:hypothetical protein
MKLLTTAIFASIMAISTAACAKEEPKKPAPAVTTPAVTAPAATPAVDAKKDEAPKTARVCVDVKDKAGQPVKNKDGTVKQNCQTVRLHKKLEGTEVPVKK